MYQQCRRPLLTDAVCLNLLPGNVRWAENTGPDLLWPRKIEMAPSVYCRPKLFKAWPTDQGCCNSWELIRNTESEVPDPVHFDEISRKRIHSAVWDALSKSITPSLLVLLLAELLNLSGYYLPICKRNLTCCHVEDDFRLSLVSARTCNIWAIPQICEKCSLSREEICLRIACKAVAVFTVLEALNNPRTPLGCFWGRNQFLL